MMQPSLQSFVDGAWRAALDETLWEDWARDLARALGGDCAYFVVLRDADLSIQRFLELMPRAGLLDEYLSGWAALDPQVPVAGRVTRSSIYVDTEHLDYSRPEVAEYMAWQKGHGFLHHMTAVVPMAKTGLRIGLPIHRATDAGPTPPEQRQRLEDIFPQIARAMRLGFEHGSLLQNAFWDGIMARATDSAALLLDERGRMLRMTDAALDIIEAQDGMMLRHGRLLCAEPGEAARLEAMIGRATAAASPLSGAIQISRPSGRTPYVTVAYPIARQGRMMAAAEATALIVLIDRVRSTALSPRLLAEAFGLTPREAELAALLGRDHSIESAAASMRIALPTARLHLRRILGKTATNRQSELVSLLGGMRG
jgi:DNA-binding CsgD family transcriptional regulator